MATYVVSFPSTSIHDALRVVARGYEAALAAAAAEAGITYAGLLEEGRERPSGDQPGVRHYAARYAARGQYILPTFRATVINCR